MTRLRRPLLLSLVALGCASLASAQEGASRADQRIFEETAVNFRWEVNAADELWLALGGGVLLHADAANGRQRRDLLGLLQSATDAGAEIFVSYDAARGAFDAAEGSLSYPLCAVRTRQTKIVVEPPCPPDPVPPPATPEQALALGQAHMQARNALLARTFLQQADVLTEPKARFFLLRARGDNFVALSLDHDEGTRAADEALVAALADYRALALLEPNAAWAQYRIGSLLEYLGADDEARAVYRNITERWPSETEDMEVALAALDRKAGDPEAALARLDAMKLRFAGERGGRYHYQRGWALLALDRPAEAAADLGKTIELQPDYHSAYFRRSCAHARLGEAEKALADLETGLALLLRLPDAHVSRSVRTDSAQAGKHRERLKRAIAQRDRTPLSEICEGFTLRYAQQRSRSPLLPPAAPEP
jgi:tetratricopeptide (TPR) repeat protein